MTATTKRKTIPAPPAPQKDEDEDVKAPPTETVNGVGNSITKASTEIVEVKSKRNGQVMKMTKDHYERYQSELELV